MCTFLSLLLPVWAGLFVVGAAVSTIIGAVDVVCSRLLVALVVVDSGDDVVCCLPRGEVVICTF